MYWIGIPAELILLWVRISPSAPEINIYARITQLGEYLLYTQEVIGSSPIAGTKNIVPD